MFFTLAFVCCITLLPATSHALNYATGIKAAPGYQLNLYPFYYAADHRTNKDGNHSVSDLGLNKYGVYIGGEVYYGRFDNVKISLAAYQDVLTYNTNEGVLVISRITIRF